jgi:sporulation integral membrane protein YtvI
MLRYYKEQPLFRLFVQLIGLALLAVLVFVFRKELLAVITPFFIALAIAYILNPIVIWLEKRKIPRSLAVMGIYVLVFGLIFLLIGRLVPTVINEVNRFSVHIPRYIDRAQELIEEFNQAAAHIQLPDSVNEAIMENLNNLEVTLIEMVKRIPEYTTGLARTLFGIFLILILTFYFLKDFEKVKKAFYNIIPSQKQERAAKIMGEIDQSLGNYIRGQLIICTVIGVSTYLALLILKVEFALILGIIAGVTNIIPYFGPFIGAFPPIIVALLQSPPLALKVAVAFFVIQQLESQILAPQVLGKSMGMHPLLVIGALITGGQFLGIPGMILGVPIAAIIRILVRNRLSHIKEESAQPRLPA